MKSDLVDSYDSRPIHTLQICMFCSPVTHVMHIPASSVKSHLSEQKKRIAKCRIKLNFAILVAICTYALGMLDAARLNRINQVTVRGGQGNDYWFYTNNYRPESGAGAGDRRTYEVAPVRDAQRAAAAMREQGSQSLIVGAGLCNPLTIMRLE
eukprot:6201994-Pleurochrysis_carterae.AAC.1